MNIPEKCQHCGAELIQGVTNQWLCGSWIHAESGAGRQTDLCRERAARQKVEKELAEALRKVVEAAGLLSKLMPYLRHQHPRCVANCECGLNSIIMEAGKAAGVVTTEAKEGK